MSRKVPAGSTPMLETERLVLRPLSADELHSLHRISNEPNVRLYLWDGEPVSEATIEGLIAHSDRMFSKEKIGLVGIRMRGREAQAFVSGAISGTKTLSCVPNLTTTLPPPASTTSPTPNLACRTLSPAR
jgi:hypothetical protein